MMKENAKKEMTDYDIKRKAVKLVVAHLKKKVTTDYLGSEHINSWINEMEKVLEKQDFNLPEYFEMKKQLNDVIERTLDEEMRYKIRDSWYSFGKALDKKVKKI
ncbi:MAG: hypothetical protein Q8942_05445 [Bacillota bacterium]|nr:hypothetical protein [Bacillota bacterium]